MEFEKTLARRRFSMQKWIFGTFQKTQFFFDQNGSKIFFLYIFLLNSSSSIHLWQKERKKKFAAFLHFPHLTLILEQSMFSFFHSVWLNKDFSLMGFDRNKRLIPRRNLLK